MTYSYSKSHTFTRTHASHIAAKVAADLKRMQRFYNKPSDEWIKKFEAEVIEFLREGYMDTVTYGFKKNGYWIEPTLHYTARDLTDDDVASDDDPGRIRPGASIDGASFYSYLIYSTAWDESTHKQQEEFTKLLPFQRSTGLEPGVSGYWGKDRTYMAGSRALDRASLRCL